MATSRPIMRMTATRVLRFGAADPCVALRCLGRARIVMAAPTNGVPSSDNRPSSVDSAVSLSPPASNETICSTSSSGAELEDGDDPEKPARIEEILKYLHHGEPPSLPASVEEINRQPPQFKPIRPREDSVRRDDPVSPPVRHPIPEWPQQARLRKELPLVAINNAAAIVAKLQASGRLMVRDSKGRTYVHEAVASGNLALFYKLVVRLLRDNSCRLLESCDHMGQTALHYACMLRQELAVGVFCWHPPCPASVNAQDLKGRTPLHLAVLSHGGQLCIENSKGQPPTYETINSYRAVKLLATTTNAQLSLQDRVGETALHYAAQHYKVDLVELLLLNVDSPSRLVSIANNAGDTALHMACRSAGQKTCCPLTCSWRWACFWISEERKAQLAVLRLRACHLFYLPVLTTVGPARLHLELRHHQPTVYVLCLLMSVFAVAAVVSGIVFIFLRMYNRCGARRQVDVNDEYRQRYGSLVQMQLVCIGGLGTWLLALYLCNGGIRTGLSDIDAADRTMQVDTYAFFKQMRQNAQGGSKELPKKVQHSLRQAVEGMKAKMDAAERAARELLAQEKATRRIDVQRSLMETAEGVKTSYDKYELEFQETLRRARTAHMLNHDKSIVNAQSLRIYRAAFLMVSVVSVATIVAGLIFGFVLGVANYRTYVKPTQRNSACNMGGIVLISNAGLMWATCAFIPVLLTFCFPLAAMLEAYVCEPYDVQDGTSLDGNSQRFRQELFDKDGTHSSTEYVKSSTIEAVNKDAKTIMTNLNKDNLMKEESVKTLSTSTDRLLASKDPTTNIDVAIAQEVILFLNDSLWKADELKSQAIETLNTHVGDCEVARRVASIGFLVACRIVSDNMNGLWLSLVCCLLSMLAAIPVTLMISRYFLRMHRYLVDGQTPDDEGRGEQEAREHILQQSREARCLVMSFDTLEAPPALPAVSADSGSHDLARIIPTSVVRRIGVDDPKLPTGKESPFRQMVVPKPAGAKATRKEACDNECESGKRAQREDIIH
ncbi:hypothetical protein MRX96_030608 [Rhipicephalus microplus]